MAENVFFFFETEDPIICNQVLEILRIYSPKIHAAEILQRATAFVTSRKLDTQMLGTGVNFVSTCSTINEIANEMINADKLNISEKCLHVIGWLNAVSTAKITEFDARKWKNIFELFKTFHIKKKLSTFNEQSKQVSHKNTPCYNSWNRFTMQLSV